METEKLRQSLLDAFEIIRQQTELLCDLANLVGPLVEAVGNPRAGLLHREFVLRQEASAAEAFESKRQTLALVDDAIRRLRGN